MKKEKPLPIATITFTRDRPSADIAISAQVIGNLLQTKEVELVQKLALVKKELSSRGRGIVVIRVYLLEDKNGNPYIKSKASYPRFTSKLLTNNIQHLLGYMDQLFVDIIQTASVVMGAKPSRND